MGLGVGACCYALHAFHAAVVAMVVTLSFVAVAGFWLCYSRRGQSNRGLRVDVKEEPRCPKGHELTNYTTRHIAWRACKCGKCGASIGRGGCAKACRECG